MRLFTALLPPPPALEELAAEVSRLRELPGAERLRWTRPEGRHLTLAFLGEVDDDLLPELGERLLRAARRHSAPCLQLAGGGRFGDRALWTGVAGDRKELHRLAASVSAGARRTGVVVEERAYRPHLTLARGGRAAPVDLRPYATVLSGFAGSTWEAEEVALVRSHLPVSGTPGEQPRYETVAAWPLGR
ncbi:MAG TPA: RNA 2',3'-cyclic phosphodiesterase [Streptomyces sp.]|nr:RNA 2',3'-cyclic phosphodiesterase [Streptomyces sp.]